MPDRTVVEVSLSQKALTLLNKATIRPNAENLSAVFHEAVVNTNWNDVSLIARRKYYAGFAMGVFALPLDVYERLIEYAQAKDVDINTLCDAIIIHYLSKKIPYKRISLCLTQTTNKLLRQNAKRKGEISKKVQEAIANTQWEKVKLCGVDRVDPYEQSTAVVGSSMYMALKQHAKARGIPVRILIESILISYYS